MLVQVTLALRQRLRVRAHLLNVTHAGAWQGQEVMAHAQQNFTHHGQITFQQEIVGFIDRTGHGILNRRHAAIGAALFHQAKNILERVAGDGLHLVVEILTRGLFRIRAMLTLEGDP